MDMQTERGDGSELFYARCAVLHAARVAGIDAFDVVWSDINDEERFPERKSITSASWVSTVNR